jgi:hypothetical protein
MVEYKVVEYRGFVERTDESAVVMVYIQIDGGYVNVWEDDELRDDIDTSEEYFHYFKHTLYPSLKEYRLKENGIDIYELDLWQTGD